MLRRATSVASGAGALLLGFAGMTAAIGHSSSPRTIDAGLIHHDALGRPPDVDTSWLIADAGLPVPDPTTTTTTEPEPVTTTTEPEPVVTTPPTTRAPRTTTTAAPTPRATTAPTTAPRGATGAEEGSGGHAYGEWEIPTYIVMCESGGSWTAQNASGAAGPYQLMPEHFGGSSALNQSHEAQHAMAKRLWAGGAGAGNWSQCL